VRMDRPEVCRFDRVHGFFLYRGPEFQPNCRLPSRMPPKILLYRMDNVTRIRPSKETCPFWMKLRYTPSHTSGAVPCLSFDSVDSMSNYDLLFSSALAFYLPRLGSGSNPDGISNFRTSSLAHQLYSFGVIVTLGHSHRTVRIKYQLSTTTSFWEVDTSMQA
jgi:hypothetical protein